MAGFRHPRTQRVAIIKPKREKGFEETVGRRCNPRDHAALAPSAPHLTYDQAIQVSKHVRARLDLEWPARRPITVGPLSRHMRRASSSPAPTEPVERGSWRRRSCLRELWSRDDQGPAAGRLKKWVWSASGCARLGPF